MRRSRLAWVLALLAAGCGGRGAPAPPPPAAPAVLPQRPLPDPLVYPPAFQRALRAGTRSLDGAPGPRYWQNSAEYRLTARVHPADKRLEGRAEIAYHNRSPDTLRTLQLDLLQNVHLPGAPRVRAVEVTGGVELGGIAVAGRPLADEAFTVKDTKLVITPPQPVAPGGTVNLVLDWTLEIPRQGVGARMGWEPDELLYVGFWYPQMAVYDDVSGWHPDPFLGGAELYSGFGDYDLTVEAPAGWLVMGTGQLLNAESVLDAGVAARLSAAAASDSVLRVLDAAAMGPGATAGAEGEWLSWRFRAGTVRDVAFAVMRNYNWDAARAPVGDRDGDGVIDYARVDAFWRPSAPRWHAVAGYERHAIEFMSGYTGLPYPWPHMSAVEGGTIIGGGMEYPMMTLMGDYDVRGDSALYWVTAHEVAHMWIPMIVGTDERRYGWMDEGGATFLENESREDYFPGGDEHATDREEYLVAARAGDEGEIMRRTDYHYPGQGPIASYRKPLSVLLALRELLGEDLFLEAYRTFIDRWAYKHPQPFDLWNTFEDVAGVDLDWFWRTWYYETWVLDQAVGAVTPAEDGTRVVIVDEGDAPMPARVVITREGGETLERVVSVDVWLSGRREAVVMVPPGRPVTRVEIDPSGVMPDVDRADNVWVRQP